MNYNFTDRVRKVLAMAREEAIRLQHDYVGTEHILLGLIREGDGVASAVLITLTVDLEQIHERVESQSGRKGDNSAWRTPYTSRAKKVLEFAMSEARDFNHSYVGTEHLLLGLLREEKGIAAQVLNSLGVTLEEARGETLKVLGSSDAETSEPAGIGGGEVLRLLGKTIRNLRLLLLIIFAEILLSWLARMNLIQPLAAKLKLKGLLRSFVGGRRTIPF